MSHTRAAIEAQPEWLAAVRTDVRLPPGRVAYTGCGTSWHAAQTAGPGAVEALEASLCHTASYTCAVAQLAALRGEDVGGLARRVAAAVEAPRLAVSTHERWLVAGAGRDWPTAQEAALKLREGAHVAAEAHRTEELLHGHLAAVDASVRCFVLEGEGRAAERARDAVRALRELGCDVQLVPTEHPAVDVVAFQLLTVDLADARGVDPDPIRRDEEPWARARRAYD